MFHLKIFHKILILHELIKGLLLIVHFGKYQFRH